MKIELLGDGAIKSHNATRIFQRLKPRAPPVNNNGNVCNDCGILVPKRRRYCDGCRDRRLGLSFKAKVNCKKP